MSRPKSWQICHKNVFENKVFAEVIVLELRRQWLAPKEIAQKINIPTARVCNWYNKDVGLTALDIYLLIKHYDFMKDFIELFAVSELETIIAARLEVRDRK